MFLGPSLPLTNHVSLMSQLCDSCWFSWNTIINVALKAIISYDRKAKRSTFGAKSVATWVKLKTLI